MLVQGDRSKDVRQFLNMDKRMQTIFIVGSIESGTRGTGENEVHAAQQRN